MLRFLRPHREPPKPPDLREIVVITIMARYNYHGFARIMARQCAQSIADEIASRAPSFPTPNSMIDWLVIEIAREEFSLTEDVFDGSAA